MIVQRNPRDVAAKDLRTAREHEADRRLRVVRTEIGLVAGYIHGLSDRHRRVATTR